MGGQVSEVSETTTRVLLEVATWNGTNILRTSNLLALRSEASTRFEKQLHPDLAMRAQRVASKLMVELCGARLVPGTIDVDAHAPRMAPFDLTYRTEPQRLPARHGDRARARLASYLDRLGFDVHSGDRGRGRVRRHRAARPAFRRHPRGRPDRGGRPGPRARRAPAGHPSRPRRRDRRPPAPSGRCCAGSRTCCGTPASTRRSPGASSIPAGAGSPGSATSIPFVVHNPLSEDQSVMRTDLIGGLLGVAVPQPRPGRRARRDLRVGPGLPAGGAARRRRAARRAGSRASARRRSPSRTGSRPC